MTGRSTGISVRNVISFFLCGLSFALLFANSAAAQVKAPQSAGVDNTKMGPYRALATLAFNSSQKGDYATAATLAKILERTWDKSEDYGGDTALSKTNKKLFDEVDKAMDQFVSLLVEHATAAPEAARLRAAYTNYLEKLKSAD
ncbi:MAG TPA: hypothetical protein VNH19_07555 [Candidatus Limnocylindrales bacterium]|nr:hypothetical protein [Candidatus Limnocylindrales bacterium]